MSPLSGNLSYRNRPERLSSGRLWKRGAAATKEGLNRRGALDPAMRTGRKGNRNGVSARVHDMHVGFAQIPRLKGVFV